MSPVPTRGHQHEPDLPLRSAPCDEPRQGQPVDGATGNTVGEQVSVPGTTPQRELRHGPARE